MKEREEQGGAAGTGATPVPARPRLPEWLDSRTIALIGTMLTVGLGIAALVLASSSATKSRIENLDANLSSRIEKVRTELGARIEDVRKELLSEVSAVEERLRIVELDVVAIRTEMGLANPSREPDADRPRRSQTTQPHSQSADR